MQIPRVARQCIVGLCDSMAGLGVDTEIVSIRYRLSGHEPKHPDYNNLYSIKNNIKFTEFLIIPSVLIRFKYYLSFARLMLYICFILRESYSGKFRKNNCNIVTARNYSVLRALCLLKSTFKLNYFVIADLHSLATNSFQNNTLQKCDGLFCITKHLAEETNRKINFGFRHISYGHTGSDVSNDTETNTSIMSDFEIPQNKKIIVYTGKVYYRYKEIDYLAELASLMPEEVFVIVVGGRPDHVKLWKDEVISRKITNIAFVSFVLPKLVSNFLSLADILIL